jgi:hypothetical protein
MIGSKRFILVLFSAAILFSMVREWNARVFCLRINDPTSVAAAPTRH